jgi:aspartyl-tRNA synthetase
LVEAQITDGGDELRMKYRYLVTLKLQNNMMLRHKMAQAMRRYLDKDFMEIETLFLIKSTLKAHSFVVPSRMHPRVLATKSTNIQADFNGLLDTRANIFRLFVVLEMKI